MPRTKRPAVVSTADFIPFAGAADALSDPTRVHLLVLLAAGPTTVGNLVDRLSAANVEYSAIKQPTVSHHLRVLRSTGFVARQQTGRMVTYTLQAEMVFKLANELIRMAGLHAGTAS